MKKTIITSLLLMSAFLTWKTVMHHDRPALAKQPKEMNMLKDTTQSPSNVLPFKPREVVLAAPAISELEEKYESFTEAELQKELMRLEEMLETTRVIEKANTAALSTREKQDLLIYMRSKAVISMKLFQLKKDPEET